MRMLSSTRVSLIDVNGTWNKSNITDKVFVRSNNTWLAEMLHLDNILGFFSLALIGCCEVRFFSLSSFALRPGVDSVILWREIPNNNLSIKTSSTKHIGVLWVEFNRGNFDWRFQDMSQGNDMVVREVEDEHIGLEGLSLDHGSQIEVHVVNHAHSYPVWLRWVELYARHTLSLAVIVVNESSGCHVGGVDLAASCCLLVSEHLEVVLEHIDDLIALESLLDSESNSVDELI